LDNYNLTIAIKLASHKKSEIILLVSFSGIYKRIQSYKNSAAVVKVRTLDAK
jgi:hypothetical protein